jgi:hypothetical protein
VRPVAARTEQYTLAGMDQAREHPLHLFISFHEEVGCLGARRPIEVLETCRLKPDVGEPDRWGLQLCDRFIRRDTDRLLV